MNSHLQIQAPLPSPGMTVLVFSSGGEGARLNLILIHREADEGGLIEAEAIARGHEYSGCVVVTGGVTRTECEPGFVAVMMYAVPAISEIVVSHLRQQAKAKGN